MSYKNKPLIERIKTKLKDDSHLVDMYKDEIEQLSKNKTPNRFYGRRAEPYG